VTWQVLLERQSCAREAAKGQSRKGTMLATNRRHRCSLVAAIMLCAVLADKSSDDVDRTDFSEQHLKEDRPASAVGPHSEVASASLMPDLAAEGKVPVGVDSVLLVSLSNYGSRMYNVTGIDGYLQDLKTGSKVERFSKRAYGESLNPREQRSFRYVFAPSEDRNLGDYRFVFSAYYKNKEKEPFMDVVFNETATVVPKPPSNEDTLTFYGSIAAAVALMGLVLYAFNGKSAAAEPKKKAQTKESSEEPSKNEWLEGTMATSGVKAKKGKKRA